MCLYVQRLQLQGCEGVNDWIFGIGKEHSLILLSKYQKKKETIFLCSIGEKKTWHCLLVPNFEYIPCLRGLGG